MLSQKLFRETSYPSQGSAGKCRMVGFVPATPKTLRVWENLMTNYNFKQNYE